jgi:hypothetical protein
MQHNFKFTVGRVKQLAQLLALQPPKVLYRKPQLLSFKSASAYRLDL